MSNTRYILKMRYFEDGNYKTVGYVARNGIAIGTTHFDKKYAIIYRDAFRTKAAAERAYHMKAVWYHKRFSVPFPYKVEFVEINQGDFTNTEPILA